MVDLGSITNFFGDSALNYNTRPLGSVYEVLILPNTIKKVGRYAFTGDSNLKAIVFKATTPPDVAQYVFNGSVSTCPVYVPDDSLNSYISSTAWYTWDSRFRGIEQLKTDDPTLYAEIKDYL